MDDQQKKLALAIVAVLAIGAGGYFVFGTGSGGEAVNERTGGPVVRKQRAAPAEATSGRKTRRKAAVSKAPKTIKRKERVVAERGETRRKKRTGGRRIKKKAKVMAPAG